MARHQGMDPGRQLRRRPRPVRPIRPLAATGNPPRRPGAWSSTPIERSASHRPVTTAAAIRIRLAQQPGRLRSQPMNVPEYITKEEVRRVCSAIGIRDWTALTEAKVTIEEAGVIRKLVGGESLTISTKDFRDGLEIELEHGPAFSDANVTNNHPSSRDRLFWPTSRRRSTAIFDSGLPRSKGTCSKPRSARIRRSSC